MGTQGMPGSFDTPKHVRTYSDTGASMRRWSARRTPHQPFKMHLSQTVCGHQSAETRLVPSKRPAHRGHPYAVSQELPAASGGPTLNGGTSVPVTPVGSAYVSAIGLLVLIGMPFMDHQGVKRWPAAGSLFGDDLSDPRGF